MKRLLCLALLSLPALAQERGDLVVGKIERRPDGLVIHYQNQGPGRLQGKGVSLRLLSGGRELVTIDGQPLPTEPLQTCQSQPVPFAALKMKPRDYYALDVQIDPRNQIAEAKEHNNSYFQQNNYGEIVEFPNFRKLVGRPRLVVERVTFAAPDKLEAFVTNQGDGITMAPYAARLTIGGLSNDLVTRHTQPVVGQTDRWVYRFEKWGVRHGQTVAIQFQVDPDHWIVDGDRSRQTLKTTLALGPALPERVESGAISGQVKVGKHRWRPLSAYACWVPSKNILSVLFFPFELSSKDSLGLTYNDPTRVSWDRARRQNQRPTQGPPFAQLELEFWPGRSTLSKDNLKRIQWHVGDGSGSNSLPGRLEDLTLRQPVEIKEGARLVLGAASQSRQDRLSIQLDASVKVHPDVPLAGDPIPGIPHNIPQSTIKGSLSFRGTPFHPQSAIGLYSPKKHSLDLYIYPRPLKSEDMTMLKVGWTTDMVKDARKGEVAFFTANWDSNDPNPKRLWVGAGLDDTGGGGSLERAKQHLVSLRAPKLGPGQPFSFRLKGVVNDLVVDLSGTAIMLEIP